MEIMTEALKDWRTLNRLLSKLREDQVLALLNLEKIGEKRVTFLERLHQRYNSLRVSREREELLSELL